MKTLIAVAFFVTLISVSYGGLIGASLAPAAIAAPAIATPIGIGLGAPLLGKSLLAGPAISTVGIGAPLGLGLGLGLGKSIISPGLAVASPWG